MTDGRLVSSRFPYLPIRIRFRQAEVDVEALLDTGFDGDVVPPARLITGGQQPPDGYLRWTLADGSNVLASYSLGTVMVGGFGPFASVVTVLGDEPLVGQGVAAHVTIILDHGRQVFVQS